MKNSLNALFVFIVLSSIYLLMIVLNFENESKYLKPLLLPVLIFALQNNKLFKTKKWLFGALLLCWMGDCILLFADQDELYFILGLLLFLMAHVLFILLFRNQNKTTTDFMKFKTFWIGVGAALTFLMVLLSILLPKLGSLTIPVIFYALTITFMLIEAIKGVFSWSKKHKYFVLSGAVLFVISDSILALDKFHHPIIKATFWIMLTYLTAQIFILYGILKLNQKKAALH